MEKAGYLQRTGSGHLTAKELHEVVDLHIRGERYAVRRSDLSGQSPAVSLCRWRNSPTTSTITLGSRGLAQVSQSGKALNIDLFERQFTVSLNALRSCSTEKSGLHGCKDPGTVQSPVPPGC